MPYRISAEKTVGTYKLSIIDWSKYISFGLRYIEDPTTVLADYKIQIERDDEYYSHSSIFGNASIVIVMKEASKPVKAATETATAGEQRIRLSPENAAPVETSLNPFLPPGLRIKDDNPNPFLSY